MSQEELIEKLGKLTEKNLEEIERIVSVMLIAQENAQEVSDDGKE